MTSFRQTELAAHSRLLGKYAVLKHQFWAIERPTYRSLKVTKQAFHNAKESSIPALMERNAFLFNDEHKLLSLRVLTDDNRLTRFMQEYLPILFTVSDK